MILSAQQKAKHKLGRSFTRLFEDLQQQKMFFFSSASAPLKPHREVQGARVQLLSSTGAPTSRPGGPRLAKER